MSKTLEATDVNYTTREQTEDNQQGEVDKQPKAIGKQLEKVTARI